jgi:hypothetical protein
MDHMQGLPLRSLALLDQLDARYQDAAAAIRALTVVAPYAVLPAQDADRHLATVRTLLHEQRAALAEVHAARRQVAARLARADLRTRRAGDAGLGHTGD